MREYFNKRNLTIAAYALGVILFAILFWLLCANLLTVKEWVALMLSKLKAIAYGVLFSLFFFPFEKTSERIYEKLICKRKSRTKTVKALSIITVYLIFLVVVAIVFTMIIPPMLTTITELRASIITSINSTREWIDSIVEDSSLLLNIYNNVTTYIYDELLSVDASSVASQIQSLSGKIFGEISDIVLGLIMSIYFLASRKYLGSIFAKMLASVCPPKWEHRIAVFLKRLYTDFTEFISARILCSLYISSITFLVCRIAGIPFYPLIFLILLVLNLIPVFGPIIGSLLTLTLVFITHRQHALLLLITILVTQLFESFIIEPAMMKKKLRPNLGTVVTLSLIAYGLFGIFGAIIAIPVFCTLSVDIRLNCARLLRKKSLPVELESYLEYSPLDTDTENK